MDAQCISDGLIGSLGVERIRELRVLQYPFGLLGYGLTMQIELDDAQSMVETLRRCSPDWELLMITTITQGTEFMSEESARCVAIALDDEVSQWTFVLELVPPYDCRRRTNADGTGFEPPRSRDIELSSVLFRPGAECH